MDKFFNAKMLSLYKKITIKVFLALVLIFLYLPIIWLIVFSFTESVSFDTWTGFSFNAYKELFHGPNSIVIRQAFGNTLLVGVITAIISTILGTFAAIGIYATRNKIAKNLYNSVSEIPMVNAEIITAIALMLLFSVFRSIFKVSNLATSFLTLMLIHISFCTPYVILNVMPRLKGLDKNLYEAAIDLGAKPYQAMIKVIIPQLLPGIITGGLLAFTLSIDDFVITQYNIDGFQTISTYIYSTFSGKKSLPPEIRALTTFIFIFLLGILTIITVKSNMVATEKEKK